MKCLLICAFLYQSLTIALSENEATKNEPVSLDGCLAIGSIDQQVTSVDKVIIALDAQSQQSQLIKLRIASFCNSTIVKQEGKYFESIVELSIEDVHLTAPVLDSIVNNLTNLLTLSLVNTELIELPDNLFANLRKLKKLVITGNQLENVTSAVFHGIDRLEVLTLSNNKIKYLAKDCFKDLSNLEELSLEANEIEELHKDVFASNKRLKALNMKKFNKNPSHSQSIAGNLFRENRDLETLVLSQNSITNMPPNIFANLTRLKVLDLSSNALLALNRDWFRHTESLEVLQCFAGALFELNPADIGRLPKLKTLNMGLCQIAHLTNESFAALPSLETLTLYGNDLRNVATETRLFAGNPKLRSVNMASCKISQLSTVWFLDLPQLDTVDLRNNRLSYLNYTELHRLTYSPTNVTFILNDNEITRFYFRSSENLHNVNGSTVSVHLDQLDRKTARCDFDFMKNYMAVQNETQRNVLLFQHKKSKRQVSKQSRSTSANECSCEGDYSPCSCYYNDSNISLNCHDLKENFSFSWWPLFDSYHHHSIKVDLSNGDLKHLPGGNWQFDSRVNQLDLSSNQLDCYSLQLNWTEKFPQLQTLNLRRNKIQQIPVEFSSYVADIAGNNPTIYLDQNDFRCECIDSYWLENLNHSNITEFIEDFENLACTFEGNTASLAWAVSNLTNSCITAKNKILEVNETSITFTVVFLVTGIVVVLAAYILSIYRNKKRAISYKNKNGLHVEAQAPLLLKYDAFISYSHKDEHFVVNELVPNLENPIDGSPKYRLCLHERDWLAGEWIIDQISQSIATSHRTIIVLSEHFIESFWGQHEFRIAYQQVIESKLRKLIVIIKDEVPDLAPLDEELRNFIANNTYLKWSDPSFWRRLRESLPEAQLDPDGQSTAVDPTNELSANKTSLSLKWRSVLANNDDSV